MVQKPVVSCNLLCTNNLSLEGWKRETENSIIYLVYFPCHVRAILIVFAIAFASVELSCRLFPIIHFKTEGLHINKIVVEKYLE